MVWSAPLPSLGQRRGPRNNSDDITLQSDFVSRNLAGAIWGLSATPILMH